MDLNALLQQGIAAAEAGDRARARELLSQVVDADERQLEAWRWLAGVVDSLEERVICLENILTLAPGDESASAELAAVKAGQAELFKPIYAPGEETPRAGVTPVATPPISAAYPHNDEFDNPWLCPYCTRPTRPQDTECPHCQQPLVITSRVRGEPSVWLWRGIIFQVGMILLLFGLWSASFSLVLKANRIFQPMALIPAYFGLPVEQPEETVQQALAAYPPWIFWGFVIALLFAVVLIGLLYFRVRHGNTVFLISASLLLALGVTLLVFFYDSTVLLLLGGLLFILGAGQLLITLNLWNDFKFKSRRLRLTVDEGASGHATLFLSGKEYAEMKMWGLAIIHYRRAIGREPRRAVYHLALAIACAKVGRYELAQKSLERAEQLDPDAPEIWRLRKKIRAQKQNATART